MNTRHSTRRMERDLVGEMEIPAEAYYGVHTARAMQNFPISGRALHPEMIRSLALIKKAAALSLRDAGMLSGNIAGAIVAACEDVMTGTLNDQFPVDAIQGGAGTSANMNANEVIANRAIERLGVRKGDYRLVNPNDHVN
ncbi:MAG TPA: lyase family protein, partial [Candidatus Limiplasma sp.]|nr:lyase family protein [Candidatus Limiplasma sp.]